MPKPHSIVLVGLGATGICIGQSLARRSDCVLVGASDIAPDRVGRDIGELLGGESSGVVVVSRLDELPSADVAVVATTSFLESLEPTLVALIERGMNVVSICEELGYAHLSHPSIVARLDKLAIEHGVSVLGTGCNPGLIMDTLPLLLSCLTQKVSGVNIRRTADMSRYGAILSKFGLGLSEETFESRQAAGAVIGHVGFEQAIAALASGLGWDLDEIVVDRVRPLFLASDVRRGAHTQIEPGTVAAVIHAARGILDGKSVIDLAIRFGFFQTGDPVDEGDACAISGDDQTIEITATRGYESFLSTVSVAANVATAVIDATPGVRTMAELPLRAIASKGSRLN
jgi:hypothetical protein